MANKHRGYVDVELDRPRRLKYNMNALAELEDVLGKPMTQFSAENVGIKELRALVWAGLLHESPDLTLREAGDLIDLDHLEEIVKKVSEALALAFPQGGQKNAKGGPDGRWRKQNA